MAYEVTLSKDNREIISRIGKNIAYDQFGYALDDKEAYEFISSVFYSVINSMYLVDNSNSKKDTVLKRLNINKVCSLFLKRRKVSKGYNYKVSINVSPKILKDLGTMYEKDCGE